MPRDSKQSNSQCKTVTERITENHTFEKLILVDENDQEIGSELKEECHLGDGILHRAFSVFIFNENKQVLIQKRSKEKMLWGKFWSNACCSHPRLGESIEDAAHRRIYEELSLESELNFIFKFQYQERFGDIGSENELCHVFIGKSDTKPNVDPSEIDDWKYMEIEELTKSIEKTPDQFTPWLKMEWSKIIGTHYDQVQRMLKID